MGASAAIYARISEDELGLERGVERQLEDCLRLAKERGLEVVGQFVDNDRSAYSGVVRAQYQRLMVAVGSGQFDKIIAYHPSRLWRQRRERFDAIECLREAGVGVAFVRGPELQLDSAYGRSMAVLMGEFDTLESEIKSERITRESLQRAQQGRANGHVAYGWQRVYDTDGSGRIVGFHDVEHNEEAAVVREIIDRLLARESIHAIVRDLNARHVPTPAVKRASPTERSRRKRARPPTETWNPTSLRALVLRPANIAQRVYKDKVLGPAEWPAIVDPDKYDRVMALLSAPERRQVRDGSRRHLLTFGIGECGVCGSPLRSGSQKRLVGRHTFYSCASQHCVARAADPVDTLVAAVVIERLSRPDAAGIFDGDDSAAREARDRAEAVRARLDLAADQYADGDIDGEQLKRITAKLRPELEAAETEARRHRRMPMPQAAEGLLTDQATTIWEALPVTAKRAVLEALSLRVVIMPSKKSGPGFDPKEIQFRWLHAVEEDQHRA